MTERLSLTPGIARLALCLLMLFCATLRCLAEVSSSVDAGREQVLLFPESAVLQGNVDDTLRASASAVVEWSQADGPGTVSFSSPASLTTTAAFSMPGIYVLRLTVRDGFRSATDLVKIGVLIPGTGNSSLRIVGEIGSHDADGKVLAFTETDARFWASKDWRDVSISCLPDDPTVRAPAVSFWAPFGTPLRQGSYFDAQSFYTASIDEPAIRVGAPSLENVGQFHIRKIAYGSDGVVTSLWATFIQHDSANEWAALFGEIRYNVESTAASVNQPPFLRIPNTQFRIGIQSSPLELSAQAVDDWLPSEGPLKAQWKQLSGEGSARFADASALNTTVTFTEPGFYTLELTVSDGELSDAKKVWVTVYDSDWGDSLTFTRQPIDGAAQSFAFNVADGEFSVKSSGILEFQYVPKPSSANTPAWSVTLIAPASGPLRTGSYASVPGEIKNPDLSPPKLILRNGNTELIPAPRAITTFDVKRIIYAEDGAVLSLWVQFTQSDSQTGEVIRGELKFRPSLVAETANRPPGVFVGTDQFVPCGQPMNLAGVVFDDNLPVGSQLRVEWNCISGPGSATFDDPASSNTSVLFDQPGEYTLQLAASDGTATTVRQLHVHAFDSARPTLIALMHQHDDGFSLTSGFEFLPESAIVKATHVNGRVQLATSKGNFEFGGPAAGPLHPGKYENAVGGTGDRSKPHLIIGGLRPDEASFEVKRVVYGPAQQVLGFWATFRARRSDHTGWISGEIRFNALVEGQSVNQMPGVFAGYSQRVPLGGKAILSAIVSDDGPQGDVPATIAWTRISGPGTATFSNSKALQTEVQFSAPGRYALSCMVSDGALSAASETVVTVYDPNEQTMLMAGRRHPNWQDDTYETCVARPADGAFQVEALGINGLRFSFSGRDSAGNLTWSVTLLAPPKKDLVVGDYPIAYELSTSQTRNAALEVKVNGSALLNDGAFRILALERNIDGSIRSLWACFRSGDSRSPQPYAGEIRFHMSAPPNKPPELTQRPVLVAAPALRMKLPEWATDDALPGVLPLRYGWKWISGPEQAYESDGYISFPMPGRYVFEVKAFDGILESAPVRQEFVVLPMRGYFAGEIRAGETLVGLGRFAVTGNGSFSAALTLSGEVLRFSAALDIAGAWSGKVVTRGGAEIGIALRINDNGQLTGSGRQGGEEYQFVMEPRGFNWDSEIGPENMPVGRLTFVMRPDVSTPAVSAGSGFGVVTTTRRRSVRVTGVLTDGTTFSAGSRMSQTNDFRFVTRLYAGRGLLSGLVATQMAGASTPFCEGVLDWNQPARRGIPRLVTRLQLLGSGFHNVHAPLLPLFNESTEVYVFTAVDDMGNIFSRRVKQLRGGRLVIAEASPEKLEIQIHGRMLALGKWRDPATGERREFAGIVIQEMRAVEGFFLGRKHRGVVFIRPALE